MKLKYSNIVKCQTYFSFNENILNTNGKPLDTTHETKHPKCVGWGVGGFHHVITAYGFFLVGNKTDP